MTAQELQDELGKTLKAFREENDKRLAEIEKTGNAMATTVQNVETLNGRIDEINASIKTLSGSVSDKLAALAVNAGGDRKSIEAREKQAKVFAATVGKPLTPEQVDQYNAGFGNFIRRGEVSNSMSVGYEQGGGYFVGPATEAETVMKVYETSPIRQLANVITISGSSNAVEGTVDNDEVSTGWTTETASITETDTPDIGKYRIEVWTQYAEPRITQQLLDDSAVNVESWLAMKVADKMSRTENTAFVSGNGSGKPRGFLDYSKVTTSDATRAWNAIQYTASGASADFASSNPADKILDMVHNLKNDYRAGASFVGARSTFGAIRKLKDGQGNYLYGVTFANGAFVETVFGFPLVQAEDMPVIAANSYSLAFGNFKKAYTIVDKQGITLLRDPYTAKPYVKFYTTKRVGGGLVNGEAIKLMKFATS